MAPHMDSEKQFIWINRLGGLVVGIFLAGAATVMWGDTRYVIRSDFEGHTKLQASFEQHMEEDKNTYATKAELKAHIDNGHGATSATLAQIQAQLAGIQADLIWVKQEVAKRQR